MTNERTQLDLFSGIGGFAIAAQWNGVRTVGFCEREPYCKQLLSDQWPSVPICGDIREMDGKTFKGVWLVTGGFPCQPYSTAGKRRGASDDRALWPEMLRVIEDARPAWVLGENVSGFVSLGLDRSLSDLEDIGYTCRPFAVPACAVGTLHERERIWIVGHDSNAFSVRPQGVRKAEERSWSREQLEGLLQGILRVSVPAGRSGGVSHGVRNRQHRLKALGNAIVPQVAAEFIRFMIQSEELQ